MKHILVFLFCLYAIGTCAQQRNSIQEAMSNYDYEKAIELIGREKITPILLYQKAIALKGLNRYFEATNVLLQILEKEPENQRITLELAECYKQTGKFNEALKCYERILSNNPESKYSHIQVITILNIIERFADAKKHAWI
ncbi:MAG: tetratricopeptide repeat protein [Bacteroides sp.]|nr:tetratricopeptide repeat protein [Bacteroides sp.]